MRLLIDADACPSLRAIIALARQHGVPVLLFCDDAHELADSGAQVVTCDRGRDSVDLALANALLTGDIVITQDYGVAALALGKQARAISPTGLVYDAGNIDGLLAARHAAAKLRRGGGRTRGPKPRTAADNERLFALLTAWFTTGDGC